MNITRFASLAVSMLSFVSSSVAAAAAPLDFKASTKAFASAPSVSVTGLIGTWTMIGLSTPDSRIATAPNGDYKADDGVVVHDTHVIDSSLKCSYNTVESLSGRVRSSLLLKGVIASGSFVIDVPNSGCHQVDSCRVVVSGHLLCKTEFLETSDECSDVGGQGAQMFLEFQR